jgi:DNA-binding response OmpR family regulator
VKSANILLVEDEERLQKALAKILEQSNYAVRTASTAEEGLRAALAERPDVLLLDVNLPDDTGWGLLRQLAARGITCQILPTIVISAGQPAPRRMEEFRPRAFLAKPFPVEALKRLIAEVLASAGESGHSPARPVAREGSFVTVSTERPANRPPGRQGPEPPRGDREARDAPA